MYSTVLLSRRMIRSLLDMPTCKPIAATQFLQGLIACSFARPTNAMHQSHSLPLPVCTSAHDTRKSTRTCRQMLTVSNNSEHYEYCLPEIQIHASYASLHNVTASCLMVLCINCVYSITATTATGWGELSTLFITLPQHVTK
jgi:hypothetical protein